MQHEANVSAVAHPDIGHSVGGHPVGGPGVGVVLVAAGRGERLGQGMPKAFVVCHGRPLLAWAFEDAAAATSVAAIVVVAPRGACDDVWALARGNGWAKLVDVVEGDRTRQGSVARGLAALPSGLPFVAIHDAARPLAGPALFDALLCHLQHAEPRVGGVVPGAPVTDTVRRIGADGRSEGVVERGCLRGIQTPQLFVHEVVVEAHRAALRAGLEATDDAALVEARGLAIDVVASSSLNLKVTTAVDLEVAAALLATRVGAMQ